MNQQEHQQHVQTLTDGYKWKYMYTLSASQQSNFLSTDFMAVETNSTVSSKNIDGAIDIIRIKTQQVQVVQTAHILILILEVMVQVVNVQLPLQVVL